VDGCCSAVCAIIARESANARKEQEVILKRIFGLLCLVAASPVFAADLPAEMQKCSAIVDSTQRLACFDAIGVPLQKSPALKKLPEEASQKTAWTAINTRSPIDDSDRVLVYSTSEDVLHGGGGVTAVPSLELRCSENKTVAYLNFDGFFMADIQGYERVTFRIDKNKAFSRDMNVSTNNKALGFWSGGASIAFIKSMFGGQTLVVRATPFNESPVTFSVKISGIEEAVKPLRKACKW
jgi:type VI secretion system protein VasI